MNLDLQGKVALVTGGSKGIGLEIARSLAAEGAMVAITARGRSGLDSALEELKPYEVVGFQGDSTVTGEVDLVCKRVSECFGRLDILVNNVGGAVRFGGFPDLAIEDWRNAFDLNVLSIVNFVRSSEVYLRKSGSGRVIIISSISALQPGQYNPHYAATKAAALNLSKYLSNYFVNDKVLVNCICAGPVHSASWKDNVLRIADRDSISFESAWSRVEAEEARKIPLGRIGEGSEIASLVSFLASERASWITGSCFHVNGGKLSTI